MLLCVCAGPALAQESGVPDDASLEASGVIVGDIIFDREDVFDLTNPEEDKWLYRLANKWHILTQERVIQNQLLIGTGDAYSRRELDESERILRNNSYLYDAAIKPVNIENGKVDLLVATKDVWTLKPGFSYSRKGGETKTVVEIEELNLLGRGQLIRFSHSDDVDRISKTFEIQDKQLANSWVSLTALYSDNSDGESSFLSVVRPFFALDTRWSAGVTASRSDASELLYDLGEKAAEYQQDRQYLRAWGGWSSGLRNGWVRRYSAGLVMDENRFSNVVDAELPPAIPQDRDLVYPFLAMEIIQDRFETTTNRNQIQRTEDYLTGFRFNASLGWSDESIGADRNALLYDASASRFFGALDGIAFAVAADLDGRLESGSAVNSRLSLLARYSHRLSERSSVFTTASATFGHDLDLDSPVELGGDSGLRGYPLRYQAGESRFLLSVEQRYFWDWYPFRLFRVGGAIFADAGRVWGDHPLGGEELGWLKDIGFGLRLAPTRTGNGKIIHVDIAFPLDGDASIDDVQLLLESKASF